MQVRNWYPFRDKQRDWPRAICPVCGQEQYDYDALEEGVCLRCARRRKEETVTLQEMAVEYRAQAEVLQTRIRSLEEARSQASTPAERAQLSSRIWDLQAIWRETRDLAVLLERYYERGYRRNARYTL